MTGTVPMRRVVAAVAVTGLLSAGIGVAAASHQFGDVPTTNFFHGEIGDIVDAGCATGFNDGTFHPAQGATRGQFAYWTANCGARVAHEAGVVDVAPGAKPFRRLTVDGGAVGGGSGFMVLTISWNAVPQAEAAPAGINDDEPRIQLLGAPAPCPCEVAVGHTVISSKGLRPVDSGRTQDRWDTDAGTGIEPAMWLSASDTWVVPIAADEQLNVDAGFTYEPTASAFADSVSISYRMTAVVVPFGWDGSQDLQPAG